MGFCLFDSENVLWNWFFKCCFISWVFLIRLNFGVVVIGNIGVYEGFVYIIENSVDYKKKGVY